MHLCTKIHSFFNGLKVGQDVFGNRYFESKKIPKNGRRKRWVIYNGRAEASKVPPEWHGWLHYTVDAPINDKKHPWQQDFLPNLTGTSLAYKPPGMIKGKQRQKATGDYQAWQPE